MKSHNTNRFAFAALILGLSMVLFSQNGSAQSLQNFFNNLSRGQGYLNQSRSFYQNARDYSRYSSTLAAYYADAARNAADQAQAAGQQALRDANGGTQVDQAGALVLDAQGMSNAAAEWAAYLRGRRQ